jgi:AcrR family transcriptional regulator
MGKKAEETRARMIESAIICLAHFGDRGTTFQKIADHCGVSQPLVVKYFKSREEIFPIVMNSILAGARERTERSILPSGSALKKLKKYLQVSLEIFQSRWEVSRIYLMFYYLSGIEDRTRKLNTEVKKIAVHRIAGILTEGVETGEFNVDDIQLAAKTIHNSLVGLLLNSITEEPHIAVERLLKALEDLTLKALRK